MYKENYCFKYPNLTCAAKKTSEKCSFVECDFLNVNSISLSGFEEVLFDTAYLFPDRGLKIDIKNCQRVKFFNLSLSDCEKVELSINGATFVMFHRFSFGKEPKLQIVGCDKVVFDADSSIDFDTSEIKANKLEISDVQIAGIKELNFMEVAQQLKIINTQVFGLSNIVVRQGVNVVIDPGCSGHDVQELITRQKYDSQQRVRS